MATIDFVLKIDLNIQNICGHKSETMWCMGLKLCMGDEHHMYYEHTKFCEVTLQFLVDLTWNHIFTL